MPPNVSRRTAFRRRSIRRLLTMHSAADFVGGLPKMLTQ
jgi:hypothetical protein